MQQTIRIPAEDLRKAIRGSVDYHIAPCGCEVGTLSLPNEQTHRAIIPCRRGCQYFEMEKQLSDSQTEV